MDLVEYAVSDLGHNVNCFHVLLDLQAQQQQQQQIA